MNSASLTDLYSRSFTHWCQTKAIEFLRRACPGERESWQAIQSSKSTERASGAERERRERGEHIINWKKKKSAEKNCTGQDSKRMSTSSGSYCSISFLDNAIKAALSQPFLSIKPWLKLHILTKLKFRKILLTFRIFFSLSSLLDF